MLPAILLLLAHAVNAPPASTSPAAKVYGQALLLLPGEAPRYRVQQGREDDVTELLATSGQRGGKLGIFRQTIGRMALAQGNQRSETRCTSRKNTVRSLGGEAAGT